MRIVHFATSSGREPVREFMAELPMEARYEVLVLLRRLEGGEMLSMPHSRSLSTIVSGLYELRVKDAQGNIRIFYYTKFQGSVYLVHGVKKKSRTIPDKDKDIIIKRIKELHRR